jgi:hypothetical protein
MYYYKILVYISNKILIYTLEKTVYKYIWISDQERKLLSVNKDLEEELQACYKWIIKEDEFISDEDLVLVNNEIN